MTNIEAITAELYPYNVDGNLIRKAGIDGDLDVEAQYCSTSKAAVAKATIAILKQLTVLASESNGNYALAYDVSALRERIYNFAKKNGVPEMAEEFNPQTSVAV